MKKKVLLIGAMMILSTTAMGTPGELSVLEARVTALEKDGTASNNEDDISGLDQRVNDNSSSIKKIESGLGTLDERVTANNEAVRSDISKISKDLKAADIDINNKIKNIKTDLTSKNEKIDAVAGKAIQDKIELEGKIIKNNNQIITATKNVNEAVSRVSAVEGKIIETNKKFDAVEGSAAKNKEDIANLEKNSATKEEVKVLGTRIDGEVTATNNRVEQLEKTTDHLQSVVTEQNHNITDISNKTTTLKGQLVKHADDIRINKEEVDTKINGVSDNLTAKDKAVNARVDGVSTDLTDHKIAVNSSIENIKTDVAKNVEDIKSVSIWVDEVITPVMEETRDKADKNKLAISSNGDLIDKNTTDLASHKEESLARDEKINVAISDLKDTDEKVNSAIGRLEDADKKFAETDGKLLATDEKLIQTDKDLKEADEKINANIATLHKHDDAVYETVGVTRDGSGTEIKAVKADVNRTMILNLENNTVTKAEVRTVENDVATNKTNIAKNTDNIDKVEKDLYVTNENGEVVVDENGNKTTQLDEFRETSYEVITSMNEDINKNSKRIDGLEKKVDGLESKMNKGLAMAAATSSIVYPHLGRGDVGIGAGIGGYGGSQAIAIGVAMQPTENVRINTNVSTSDTSDTMYGAGVGYKFNIFGS